MHRMKKRRKRSEPFIPNDGLYKTRKIEFRNPHAVPGKKSYGSNINDKRPEIKTVGVSPFCDKDKILRNLNEEIEQYPAILSKLNSSNLVYSIKKLSKEERNIVLIKYYESIESKHSYTVFKQSYIDFLERKTLTASVFTERIINFLKNEIKK